MNCLVTRFHDRSSVRMKTMFGRVCGFALTAAAAVAVASVGDFPAKLRSTPARTTAAVISTAVPICNVRRRRDILHLHIGESRTIEQRGVHEVAASTC